MNIDQAVEMLGSIGWLAHLPPAKRKRIHRDLGVWHERNPAWMYLGLATASYDTEMIEDDDDYADLVRIYRRASGDVFDARDIESKVDLEKQQAFVAFSLAGRHFEATFSLELGDYVAEDFEPFINRCLAEAGIERRFYTLPMIDQVAHVSFVPAAVYAAAESAGLLGGKPVSAADDRDPGAPHGPAIGSENSVRSDVSAGMLPVPVSPRTYLVASAVGTILALLAGGVLAPPSQAGLWQTAGCTATHADGSEVLRSGGDRGAKGLWAPPRHALRGGSDRLLAPEAQRRNPLRRG